MTVHERDAIGVLTDHVMDLKQDMGEVKADLRALKGARAAEATGLRAGRSALRTALVSLGCVALGGLPYVAHTYLGWGQS